jgi:uncharacterized LabA/DUF88 family protein
MKLRIAVFIDGENIGARHWPEIEAMANALGTINVCQIYGDFTDERLGKWLKVARSRSVQPVLQLAGKNASDIAIAIAAMDLLHAGKTEAIVLATSDQDLTALALRLRTAGIRVYGAGLSNAPASLRNACTAFTELGTAVKQAAA